MDKVVNNDSNQPEEKDAIPSNIFIPVFSVLGEYMHDWHIACSP